MRRVLAALPHPLWWLSIGVGLNYLRSEVDLSTVCSVTRRWVPWPLMVLGGFLFNAWFWPHWLRPKLKGRR